MGNELILHEGFQLSFSYKTPNNTVGVHRAFFYGQIDGVELGKACNTMQECKIGLVKLLTQTKPYSLVEYLTEKIEYLQNQIKQSFAPNMPDDWIEARCGWKEELNMLNKLLSKVVAYTAEHKVQIY